MKLIGDKPLTAAERQRRYRQRHPERAKEIQRRYKENNPGATAAASRRFYERNAESEKARSIEWRRANPEAARKIQMRSHYKNYESDIMRMAARRAAVRAYVSDKDIRRIMSQSCAECGSNDNLHLDHIVPLSRGGKHTVGNLQMLCGKCNLSKNKSLTVEWRQRKLKQAA